MVLLFSESLQTALTVIKPPKSAKVFVFGNFQCTDELLHTEKFLLEISSCSSSSYYSVLLLPSVLLKNPGTTDTDLKIFPSLPFSDIRLPLARISASASIEVIFQSALHQAVWIL